jgi:hypothetical protein
MSLHRVPSKTRIIPEGDVEEEKQRLAKYISSNIDPLVQACVLMLILNRPENLSDSIIEFVNHRKENPETVFQLSDGLRLSKSKLPKEIYIRTRVDFAMKKIVRAVSLSKPADVLNYLSGELPRILSEPDVITFERKNKPLPWKFSRSESATVIPSEGDIDLDDSLSLKAVRPHTAPFIRHGIPDEVKAQPCKSAGPTPSEPIFVGGVLHFDILFAEKFSGDGMVFGNGRFPSFIQVNCGGNLLKQATVSAGSVSDESFSWSGYTCDIEPIRVTADMRSSRVDIMIFDSNRRSPDEPLGIAMLDLRELTSAVEFTCTLAIEPAIAIDPIAMLEDDLSMGSVDGTALGSITLRVKFSPFIGYKMYKGNEYRIDITYMSNIEFAFGWRSDDIPSSSPRLQEDFGATLLMFDMSGKFMDAVDATTTQSRRGPPSHHRILPADGFGTDLIEITVHFKHILKRHDNNKTIIYVLMVSSRRDDVQLSDLRSMYVRVTDGGTKRPHGRYDVSPERGASACVMARVWRNLANDQVGADANLLTLVI